MSSLALDHRQSGTTTPLGLRGAAGAQAPLIEREREVEALVAAVDRLDCGRGAVVLLEAAAGLGKSVLLEHTSQVAAEFGHAVRRAAPGPLERGFAFGVVRTLLEAPLRERTGHDQAELLRGPAAMAGALLLDGWVPGEDATTMLAHSLLWLCRRLAERSPLALVVDDAHWADRASLQVLSYLARRLDDVPLLIVVAARTDDPSAPNDRLSELGTVGAATVLRPEPLTPTGGVKLIRRLAPNAPTQVCCECHRAAAGTPWLIGELARQIAEQGPGVTGPGPAQAAPVTPYGRTVVRRRMAELGARERAVAGALAVIGDAHPHVLGAVAAVAVQELSCAHDALRAAGLLSARGERFAHNLIAVAIREDLAPAERERLHRAAARELIGAGAAAEVIASHLLRCRPQGDPGASEALVRAASAAARRGAPDTAAAYLDRALAERAPDDERGQMLAQLATVAFDAGMPDSRQLLQDALREVGHGPTRVDLLTRLAALGVVDGADARVEEALEQLNVDESDADARIAAEAAALDMLLTVPGRSSERAWRARAVRITPAVDPLHKRVVVAHRAWVGTELGAPDAGACAALALQALDGDLLLHAAGRRPAYHLCIRALVMADRVDHARVAIAELSDEAMARGSLRLRAAAAWYAAELALRTGRVADAEKHARSALEVVEGDVNVFTSGALAVLIAALGERGEFDEARDLLRARAPEGPTSAGPREVGVRHARARLALCDGDFERAYADACEAGRGREQQGRLNPAWTPWRSTAALALAHLGRLAEAAQLADSELALAERFGAPVPIARALHARAVAEADDGARLALCERGLAKLAGKPAILETVRLRLELGSTLAYTGRRVEARDALRPALSEADGVGATLLAQRARRELVATGLRPRRAALDGVAALTPRQRQVCDHAAAGMSNRAISHALFLSIKTVETHLAAGYRKLGVNSRRELAAKLHECPEPGHG